MYIHVKGSELCLNLKKYKFKSYCNVISHKSNKSSKMNVGEAALQLNLPAFLVRMQIGPKTEKLMVDIKFGCTHILTKCQVPEWNPEVICHCRDLLEVQIRVEEHSEILLNTSTVLHTHHSRGQNNVSTKIPMAKSLCPRACESVSSHSKRIFFLVLLKVKNLRLRRPLWSI